MKERRAGFTLIEILVVVAIIGILISIILPVLSRVRDQAKVTRTKALMDVLSIACDLYYNDWGGIYPPAFANPTSPSKNEGIEMLYKGLTKIGRASCRERV